MPLLALNAGPGRRHGPEPESFLGAVPDPVDAANDLRAVEREVIRVRVNVEVQRLSPTHLSSQTLRRGSAEQRFGL